MLSSSQNLTIWNSPTPSQPLPHVAQSERRDSLGTLERVSRLQRLPSLDGSGLDADHVPEAVLGRKVGHASRLIRPGVPHHHVCEVVTHHREPVLAGLAHRYRRLRLRARRIHPVRLARDGDVPGLRLGLGAVNFVYVLCLVETDNVDFGYILDRSPACQLFPSLSSLSTRATTYLYPQIRMQQHLAIKRLVVVVGDDEAGAQTVPIKGNAVNEVESVGPLFLRLGIEAGRGQAEVELDREVGMRRVGCRLGRRLA